MHIMSVFSQSEIHITHFLVPLASQLPRDFSWRNDKWANDTSKRVRTFTYNDRWQTARITNSCSTELQMNKPIRENTVLHVNTFSLSVPYSLGFQKQTISNLPTQGVSGSCSWQSVSLTTDSCPVGMFGNSKHLSFSSWIFFYFEHLSAYRLLKRLSSPWIKICKTCS
jgi:hypothetical protein